MIVHVRFIVPHLLVIKTRTCRIPFLNCPLSKPILLNRIDLFDVAASGPQN